MSSLRVFMCGIGGIGMCGVARILKELGFEVAGSDRLPLYPPSSEILENLKIPVFNFNSQNLERFNPGCLIVGNSISRNNEEVIKAKEKGIPLFSFPKFLKKVVLLKKKVLVCAGTHGKTTSTSLLAYLLEGLNQNPGYLIGGVLKKGYKNASLGSGDYFVIEGDEYPSAFFDKNPKFLHYLPFGLLVTSLEHDHIDVYPRFDDLKKAFKRLIESLPPEGVLVYNADDENLNSLVNSSSVKAKIFSYGKAKGGSGRLVSSKTHFKNGKFETEVIAEFFGKKIKFLSPLVGEYNSLNLVGVITLLKALNLWQDKGFEVLMGFKGVKRRQEVFFCQENLLVIDDFAHHPSAVSFTLEELRKAYQPERLVTIFEPRTNSSKRKVFEEDYIRVFSRFEEVIFKEPPFPENLKPEERIDIPRMVKELKKLGKNAAIFKKSGKLNLKSGEKTLIVCMSSAYMEEVMEWIKLNLESRLP